MENGDIKPLLSCYFKELYCFVCGEKFPNAPEKYFKSWDHVVVILQCKKCQHGFQLKKEIVFRLDSLK